MIDDPFNVPPTPLKKRSEGGFTLHYANEHRPTKDCDIDNIALRLAYEDVYTSTGLVVEAALCYIMEGVLVNVSITVEGRPLTINRDRGLVTNWSAYPNSANYAKRMMMAMIDRYGKIGL